MILTDSDIQKRVNCGDIAFLPKFDRSQLGSNSYDLTLARTLMVYKQFGQTTIEPESPIVNMPLDCREDNPTIEFQIPDEGFVLQPGELYLGATVEATKCKDLCPMLEGKSSIGRLGMSVHVTAGFGDIGFEGHWTLEITVVRPLRIYAHMPIAQIYFLLPLGKCEIPYKRKMSAKYDGQSRPVPVPSAMYKNFPLSPPMLK